MGRLRLPLRALVALEAVGRRLCVKVAAVELGRTAPAASQLLHVLEESLGVDLMMVRQRRSLELTAAGEAYLPVVRKALTQMSTKPSRALSDWPAR